LQRSWQPTICPGDVDDVTTESIRAFLVSERERTAPAYAQQHHRNLSVFWNWLVMENQRTGENPMARVSKPEVPARAHPPSAASQVPCQRQARPIAAIAAGH
jgi:hypothetical protein